MTKRKKSTASNGKATGLANLRPFPKGVSGNPSGRKPLPPDLKAMRDETLAKAITIMHAKVHDEEYVECLKPGELTDLLGLVFDRCGLPRVTKSEGDAATNNDLANTIREVLAEARKHNVIVPLIPSNPETRPEYPQ